MVEFVSELNDPNNQIRDRRPPDPDRSSLVMSEAFTNLGKTIGPIAASFMGDSKAEAYSELENELQLNVIETGLKQGRITQDEAFLRSESSLKKVIAKYPTLAPELREYAKGKLGFNPTEKLLGNLMQEDAEIEKLNNEARDNIVKDAIKTGNASYNEDNTIDIDKTISNYSEDQYLNKVVNDQKRLVESGKLGREEFETNFKQNYVKNVGLKVNTMINNMYKSGVEINGKIVPLSQVPKEQLAGIVQQASAKIRLELNSSLSKAELSPQAIKDLQETTDSFLKDTEALFLGRDEAELKQIETNIKLFKANTNQTLQDTAPILAQQIEIFGKEAIGQEFVKETFNPEFKRQMSTDIKNLFNAQGKKVPVQYSDGNFASTVISNLQQTATDSKAVNSMSNVDIKATAPVLIKGIRSAWKNPNNMTEKGDKSYPNLINNLAEIGLRNDASMSDVKNIVAEISNPAQIQTFKAVQARGVDAEAIRTAGETQGLTLLQNIPKLEKVLFDKYNSLIESKAITLGRDVTTGKLFATVDNKMIEGSKPSAMTQGVIFGLGMESRQPSQALKINADINSDIKLINQAVDALVKLKDFSDYGSLTDGEFKDVLQNTTLLRFKGAIGYSMPKEEKKMKAVTGDGKELLIPALPDLEGTLLDQIDSGETNSN